MDLVSLSPGTTVAQTLEDNPRASKVFMSGRMACVGCCMARFCTLWDVAAVYELQWDWFVDELNRSQFESNSNPGGGNAQNR